ncbi:MULTISPECIES: thiosulfate oxidation carrier complex protein SoxZ [unclassified Pseudomonas]|uniref:thiosulfate oxidation carrier complex protein SoxZ n=1 Tax=unclassified Pseudomonas TaxID=196821 RepID=UPI00244B5856|nr:MULTISPECIES: thiosulfate oxidation carrier complex protein SoxZ [unclassified Pseudomonas]MDG9928823.1 thiosulfate oxidation carrier complex protein SoxZ [Pseudomonas sp. GD04042]MDH0485662.1 thiosulfate oxidation carrier complex protein SoxZ [Pseudomonas sp. GD04015]MDH0603264.1 thiosulfate oxidation carrier complex protein SoxZ [Pseudomonas sp. GD03869]
MSGYRCARRTLLAILSLCLVLPLSADPLHDERERLLADGMPQAEGLALEVPEWVEDGAFVAVTLSLRGARPPLRLVLLREEEDEPRIARVELRGWHEPLRLSTRVRLPRSQALLVLARDADGRTWAVRQLVRIAGSSCLSPPLGDPAEGLGRSQAWRRPLDGGSELASLLRHPMETGQRHDADGRLLPRHLLRELRVSGERGELMRVEVFAGLAANPYWRVVLPVEAGELGLRWRDDDGATFDRRLP